MNFGWENVHEIAEQLEHVHSEMFFDKMDELLQFPKFDPHGEPIPNKDGAIISLDLQKLSKTKKGETVTFSAVTVSDDDFLNFLNSKELELGNILTVLDIEKYDESMTIGKDDESKIVLSKMVCDKILVKI